MSAAFRQQMIDHVLAHHPDEGCGLFAVDATGRVRRVYPLANVDASPTRFTVDPDGHYAAVRDTEANGWEIGGVFHSHPHGVGRPSPVDVAAPIDPRWVHLVIGLSEPERPEVRAWRIEEGIAVEVALR